MSPSPYTEAEDVAPQNRATFLQQSTLFNVEPRFVPATGQPMRLVTRTSIKTIPLFVFLVASIFPEIYPLVQPHNVQRYLGQVLHNKSLEHAFCTRAQHFNNTHVARSSISQSMNCIALIAFE